MLEVGTRVKISGDYLPYKSMRGLEGVITWKLVTGHSPPLYAVQTDITPARLKRNTCFVEENDLAPL